MIIDPLQEDFAFQLVKNKGGVFFLEEINPSETQNSKFSKKITSRFDHVELANQGIKVTYRGINTSELDITFPEADIVISGTLKDNTKSGKVWLYAFPEPVANNNLSNIPNWIKNNAAWWSQGTITDSDFLTGIEYMIQNNILEIQQIPTSTTSTEEIPSWIRNNAEWWSSGLISDEDFLSGIKYLIEVGIISYQ